MCTKAPDTLDDVQENSQCCLGHLVTQLGGISKEYLKKGEFSRFDRLALHLKKKKKKVPEVVRRVLSSKETEFYRINDAPLIPRKEREKELKKLFRSIGITVKFYGRG